MTSDELLDAHMQRLRDDPGYAAIWRMAFAHPVPIERLLFVMLAWAEHADGLRAIIRANNQISHAPQSHEKQN